MADPREAALQAMRTWLKSVFDLPDARVILKQYGSDPATRPEKTYFCVEFTGSNDHGQPERSTLPTKTRWSVGKHATLRVTATGPDAGHWLDVAGLMTHEFNDPNFTIGEPLSGTLEMSQRHGATMEYSAMRDFLLMFHLDILSDPPVYATKITTELI